MSAFIGTNLLTNPGAESGAGVSADTVVPVIPGWTTTGSFTVIDYDTNTIYPLTSAEALSYGGGTNYFAGGPAAASSSASQAINLSAIAPLLATGTYTATISGWLGGFDGQDDFMALSATFLNATGGIISTDTLTGPDSAARGGVSELLFDSGTVTVPAGTSSVEFTMLATRLAGSDDDGYADNVSFVINAAAVGVETIDAGSGAKSITLPAGGAVVTTRGSNTIYGSVGSSTVNATAGNPLVFGQATALTFIGGSGAATVVGGSVASTVTGGSGTLVLFAVATTAFTPGTGSATIVGGATGLTASLGQGGGVIYGGVGGVNLISSSSTAALSGLIGVGDGDVLTASGAGSEIMVAGAGAETLNAAQTTGANALYGGSGADVLLGGSGGDFFIPGSGPETLTGGLGFNGYIYTPGVASRVDTITDFDVTHNQIGLFGYGANAAQNAFASMSISSGSTSITLSDKTTIILTGVTSLGTANILAA